MTDSFDELSARARRGELSRAEQQRLDVLLKASLEARLWHDAGRQLDAEDAVLPGDHDAVERVMQRALGALPAQRVRGRRRVGVLVAVAALCLASVAAASIEGVRYWRAQARSLTAQAARPAAKQGAARVVVPRVSVPAEVAPPVAVAVVAPAAPSAAPLAARSGSVVAGKSKSEPGHDAVTLFGAAALARREGNAAKAIALFDSLQERFPGSREARLSDMTLGALHLQRGAASDALEHFRRYLRAAPQGGLASEALWGEFQALSALGQRGEAERRLRLLVERFPGSAYATAARAKLKSAGP